MDRDGHSDQKIREILGLKNVAVVGASREASKAARFVPEYLAEHGFNIIPVNPKAGSIMNRKCYKGVEEIPDSVDIVDVFRPSDQVMSVIDGIISKKPKVIWLQEGIHNPEAEGLARERGIDVVFDRCMLAEHRRLFG